MRSSPSAWSGVVLGLSLLGGCAALPAPTVIDNHNGKLRHLPREDRSYQGQGYRLAHLRAHPLARGASSGLYSDGGEINGEVCGAAIRYQIAYQGDHVELRGQVAGEPAHLRVSDQAGRREFNGVIGEAAVTLALAPEGVYERGALQPPTADLLALPPPVQAALLSRRCNL